MMAQLRDTTAHQESSHFEGEQRGQQVRLDPDKRADIPRQAWKTYLTPLR